MSKYMSAQSGRYVHAPDLKWAKVFEEPGGAGRRTFTIVVASAYNAGIVGPEMNGVVVLDEDGRKVVVDEMARASSGYFGPSAAQMTLANRLREADWHTFVDIIKSHPKYRGTLEQGPPVWRYAPDPRDDRQLITDEEAKDWAQAGYEMVTTRFAMIKAISAHSVHRDGYGPSRLAWNVKVGDFDTSGRTDGQQTNPALDEAWAEYLSRKGDHVWDSAAAEARYPYLNGEFSTYPGNDGGQYTFAFEGRSGGWLVLAAIQGVPGRLQWESLSDLEQYVEELPDHALRKLYVAVRTLDHDLTPAKIAREMAEQYAAFRAVLEDRGELVAARRETVARAP